MSAASPELTFEALRRSPGFPEFALRYSDADLELYRDTIGDPQAGADGVLPPAFAAIFGRQAYLRDHRMPAGGVLLAQDIHWLRPARIDEDLLVRARAVETREHDDGRRVVVFETTARQQGVVVARVWIKVGWPS